MPVDTYTSASQALFDFSRPTERSRVGSQASAATVMEQRGVALAVPYLVRVGVSAVSDMERDEVETQLKATLQSIFRSAEMTFSPFNPQSELCRLNAARTTEPIAVSKPMHDVLTLCDALVQWSEGAFDPTCVPAGKWAMRNVKQSVLNQAKASGRYTDGELHVLEKEVLRSTWFPEDDTSTQRCMSLFAAEAVSNLRSSTLLNALSSEEGTPTGVRCPPWGWRSLIDVSPPPSALAQFHASQLNHQSVYWVRKRDPHVEVDLCAVSKGWTVDRIAERLVTDLSVFDGLIDWGGDVRAFGRNPVTLDAVGSRTPWSVGLLHPEAVCRAKAPSPLMSPVWDDDATGGAPFPPLPGRAVSTDSVDSAHATTAPLRMEAVLVFPADGASVCTSGDYFQWCHLVPSSDPVPHTSGSSSLIASVTLMLDFTSCALCDGLSTALYLLMSSAKDPNGGADGTDRLLQGIACRLRDALPGHIFRALTVYVRDPSTGSVRLSDLLPFLQSSTPLEPASSARMVAVDGIRRAFAAHIALPTTPPTVERPWWCRRNATLDGSSMRTLSRSIPRSVAVLMVPIPLKLYAATAESAPYDPTQTLGYFAVALSSVVQLSATSFFFFLQKRTAVTEAFMATCSPAREGGDGGRSFRLAFVTGADPRRQALIESFHGGRLFGFDAALVAGHPAERPEESLDDVVKQFDYVGSYSLDSVTPAGIAVHSQDLPCVCGDHVGVCAVWSSHVYGRMSSSVAMDGGLCGEWDASDRRQLLRFAGEYVKAEAPTSRALGRVRTLARMHCIATVAIAHHLTGAVRICLGTVLHAVDVLSREPLIVSAFARPGRLGTELFGPAACREGSEVRVARLHFFSGVSKDLGPLVDWFSDGTCIDPGQQFMYHGAPPQKLRAPNGRWVHPEYHFAGSAATLDCALIESFPCDSHGGSQNGFLILMSPTHCKLSSSAFLSAVCFH